MMASRISGVIMAATLETWLFDTIRELDAAQSEAAVLSLLLDAVGQFGFESLLVTGLPRDFGRIEPYVMVNGWSPGWFDLYTERNLVHNDPIAQHCFQTNSCFSWSEVCWDNREDKQARFVMSAAEDFGLLGGFCVPIHDPRGFQAVVTMAGDDLYLTDDIRRGLHLLSIYAHACAHRLNLGLGEQITPLKGRVREVVRWAAMGKTNWEISVILNISEKTVEYHMSVAARLLQTTNRTHTVAEAMRRGQLDL